MHLSLRKFFVSSTTSKTHIYIVTFIGFQLFYCSTLPHNNEMMLYERSMKRDKTNSDYSK